MRSQHSGVMLVLSRFMSCIASASQISLTSGTADRSWAEVIAGDSPSPWSSDAMVPPVAIIKIRFIKQTSFRKTRVR